MNAIVSVCEQNPCHPRRTFIALVKERMINDGRVPVRQAQLNVLIKDMGDGKSLPMFWNTRGAPEIMPLQELRDLYDIHTKRDGNGWTKEDTKNALVQKMKAKREADGFDSSTIKPPDELTILAYDLALSSMPDLVMRACQTKNARRESSATSVCSMLSFVCAILTSCAHLAPSTESIPEEYCFDESKATEGCKLACRLVAESYGVPVKTVQFIP